MTALRQGTPEWVEARRAAVSSTDLPVILGLSPYRCEADLAAEKMGEAEPFEPTLPMRVGLAVEPLIREEYERQTGERLRRVHVLERHPSIEWAVASPDYAVVGKPWLVEAKWSTSGRWRDGLPQDVEAQVQWALGVTGRERADVAALLGGSELRITTVEYDDETFEGLLDIAADFRARLEAGGPFAQSSESVRRRYPADNGMEMVADAELEEAVRALVALRGSRKAMEHEEEVLETAIKTRMADAAVLVGRDWRVTWKRTKDRSVTDWKPMAEGLLRERSADEQEALLSLYTRTEQGFRPFRITTTDE